MLPEKITEKICLESNYKFSFSISSSFGDGLCCVEGDGSHVWKIDGVAIGDFKKSEQFWFKFQNCVDDGDYDEGDLSTTSVYKDSGTTCACFPRECHDYGHMVQINATTYNFPESATWVIEDEEEITKHEGGSRELSKRTFTHDACLPDGVHKLRKFWFRFDQLQIRNRQ